MLHPGQTVVWNRPPWDEAPVPRHYELIHEDDAIVVVNKPSGLPTMPAGGFLDNTLLALVRERYPEASPLHRLGRGHVGPGPVRAPQAARRRSSRGRGGIARCGKPTARSAAAARAPRCS